MELTIRREFAAPRPTGPNSRQLMRMFGLDRRMLAGRTEVHACRIRLEPGRIVLITGPSGSGKSVLLEAMYAACPPRDRLRLEEIGLDAPRSLIDCMETDFETSLRLLCQAGLGDVFTLLQRPARLSLGQQYRYRLARALLDPRRYIFADEFCSLLDRTAARITAFRLRRAAAGSGKCFILATAHEDLLDDLRPDVILCKQSGEMAVLYRP